jgi:hypothetical protein
MGIRDTSWLLPVLVASVMTGCGPEEEAGPLAVPVEEQARSRAAVISGATRGATVRAVEGVNLRSGASTSSGVLLTVPAGQTATVLDPTPSGGFYKVNYQGTVGWTHGDYWTVQQGLWVNGYALSSTQEQWVRWIGTYSVPKLLGDREARLTVASRVAWWSLKEGVLGLANPFVYSNCSTASGDTRIEPLATCAAGWAWQVGLSGVQVPNIRTLAQAQSTSASIHKSLSESQVLGATANQAGFATGTATYNSIVNSSGDLRKSWLLRNHAVGITLQEPFVTSDCITGSISWCYGTSWTESARYAPNRAEALESIREIKAILDGIAP